MDEERISIVRKGNEIEADGIHPPSEFQCRVHIMALYDYFFIAFAGKLPCFYPGDLLTFVGSNKAGLPLGFLLIYRCLS